jgi:hypothetical protein
MPKHLKTYSGYPLDMRVRGLKVILNPLQVIGADIGIKSTVTTTNRM